MTKNMRDRRKYSHYDTELKIYFEVKYDMNTKIEFSVIKKSQNEAMKHKYAGICRNVSAEGLCFASEKKMKRGDLLLLDVYAPNTKKPVRMEGWVRWSRKLMRGPGATCAYHTGVLLISAGGNLIADSIYFDKDYKVAWSAALDSLFGTFALMRKAIKNPQA